MTDNSFGHLFRVTTWGESHGPAIGCVLDGVPPGLKLAEADIQSWLDKRKPGSSRFVTQRKEPDAVEILSGVFEGKTTGTALSLMIRNQDARSRDYSAIKDKFRPGHADYTYWKKYGIRDYRGGGRSSARETACRVAAGAVARKILGSKVKIRGAMVQMGEMEMIPEVPTVDIEVEAVQESTETILAVRDGSIAKLRRSHDEENFHVAGEVGMAGNFQDFDESEEGPLQGRTLELTATATPANSQTTR